MTITSKRYQTFEQRGWIYDRTCLVQLWVMFHEFDHSRVIYSQHFFHHWICKMCSDLEHKSLSDCDKTHNVHSVCISHLLKLNSIESRPSRNVRIMFLSCLFEARLSSSLDSQIENKNFVPFNCCLMTHANWTMDAFNDHCSWSTPPLDCCWANIYGGVMIKIPAENFPRLTLHNVFN